MSLFLVHEESDKISFFCSLNFGADGGSVIKEAPDGCWLASSFSKGFLPAGGSPPRAKNDRSKNALFYSRPPPQKKKDKVWDGGTH